MKALLGLMLVFSLSSFADYQNTKKVVKSEVKENMKPTQMDDLIRGEMSAVKAYRQVLEKVKDKSDAAKLTAILRNHEKAVTTLKKHASADVLEDTQTVGPWGTFVAGYTGSAKIFGDKTALKALRQGEEHGLNEYKEALDDKNISADVKQLIRSDLMPKQEEHISVISESL